jgi:hypothetical protein
LSLQRFSRADSKMTFILLCVQLHSFLSIYPAKSWFCHLLSDFSFDIFILLPLKVLWNNESAQTSQFLVKCFPSNWSEKSWVVTMNRILKVLKLTLGTLTPITTEVLFPDNLKTAGFLLMKPSFFKALSSFVRNYLWWFRSEIEL